MRELEDEVRGELEREYGHVVHLSVDAASGTKGEVYIKFEDLGSSERAIKGLSGRFFDGKQLVAQPVIEMVYSLKFPKSKDL